MIPRRGRAQTALRHGELSDEHKAPIREFCVALLATVSRSEQTKARKVLTRVLRDWVSRYQAPELAALAEILPWDIPVIGVAAALSKATVADVALDVMGRGGLLLLMHAMEPKRLGVPIDSLGRFLALAILDDLDRMTVHEALHYQGAVLRVATHSPQLFDRALFELAQLTAKRKRQLAGLALGPKERRANSAEWKSVAVQIAESYRAAHRSHENDRVIAHVKAKLAELGMPHETSVIEKAIRRPRGRPGRE